MFDAMTPIGDATKPRPGDMTFCIGCGEPLVFKDNLKVRLLTGMETVALPPSVLAWIKQTQRTVQRVAGLYRARNN